MSILDTTIVNVALETLGRDLHTTLADIQWVITGYMLSLAAVIPVTGWAAKREHVPGDHPLDVRERRMQVASERLQRDVDDRRVEDRHDRPDHHDRRDAPDMSFDAVGRGRFVHGS